MLATRCARIVLSSLAGISLLSISHAQSVLYTFDGAGGGYWFGFSVNEAGDVDGDGFDDVIVGAFGDNHNGKDSGSATVLSGYDGSTLFTFYGDGPMDGLGHAVCGAGDVDRDGHADLIVGVPFSHGGQGVARVFSGRDGSLLFELQSDDLLGFFGHAVADAGDVNGDGHPDLLVGAPGVDGYAGAAHVFSGRDGAQLHEFHGANNASFGYTVSAAGDVNQDGFDDFAVGAPFAKKDRGRVRVFSGADGSVLHDFVGTNSGQRLGWNVSTAGDVDGDGTPDLAATTYTYLSRAVVFSGFDGSVLIDYPSQIQNAYPAVSGAGDVDGDGRGDLLVALSSGSGHVDVVSGRNGERIFTVAGDSYADQFGWSLSGAGDIDGDGFADLIVGAYLDDNNHNGSGSARVFSGCPSIGESYCGPAVPNSTGRPGELRAGGSPAASEDYLVLRASDLPPDRVGILLASSAEDFIPQAHGGQGNLCLGGPWALFADQATNTGVDGRITIRVDLTNLPTDPPHAVQAGETWYFQAWHRDENPGPTSNLTNGVRVTFR